VIRTLSKAAPGAISGNFAAVASRRPYVAKRTDVECRRSGTNRQAQTCGSVRYAFK
jgi:hypothetical protein